MTSFNATYGKTAGMISGVDLLNGIARLAGIKNYFFEGITDGPDNDYAAQGDAALKVLAEKDVVFVHVEAPDAEGHDGNAAGKLAAVEAIDREIISRLIAYGTEQPLRILALPDHPTPASLKRHTRDLVPFVLAGPGIIPEVAGRASGGLDGGTGSSRCGDGSPNRDAGGNLAGGTETRGDAGVSLGEGGTGGSARSNLGGSNLGGSDADGSLGEGGTSGNLGGSNTGDNFHGGGTPATRLTEAQAAATGIVVDPGYLLMQKLLTGE
jgi:hypothetical protein